MYLLHSSHLIKNTRFSIRLCSCLNRIAPTKLICWLTLQFSMISFWCWPLMLSVGFPKTKGNFLRTSDLKLKPIAYGEQAVYEFNHCWFLWKVITAACMCGCITLISIQVIAGFFPESLWVRVCQDLWHQRAPQAVTSGGVENHYKFWWTRSLGSLLLLWTCWALSKALTSLRYLNHVLLCLPVSCLLLSPQMY